MAINVGTVRATIVNKNIGGATNYRIASPFMVNTSPYKNEPCREMTLLTFLAPRPIRMSQACPLGIAYLINRDSMLVGIFGFALLICQDRKRKDMTYKANASYFLCFQYHFGIYYYYNYDIIIIVINMVRTVTQNTLRTCKAHNYIAFLYS